MKEKTALFVSVLIFLASGALVSFKDPLIRNFLKTSPVSELDNPKLVKEIRQQTGEWNPNFSQPIFLNKSVPFPLAVSREERVLGVAQAQGEKWIEVDLSDQKLYAHEGDKIVYEFLVSTGKWAPTPTGEFRIWIKLRYTKMSGGNKEDGSYYYLPNVPFVMFFHNGFGFHGTYWHNNFGTPMSHGCVNLSTIDAEKLYWWTSPVATADKTIFHPTKSDPGTRVVIHD